jgi:hypothetical protein
LCRFFFYVSVRLQTLFSHSSPDKHDIQFRFSCSPHFQKINFPLSVQMFTSPTLVKIMSPLFPTPNSELVSSSPRNYILFPFNFFQISKFNSIQTIHLSHYKKCNQHWQHLPQLINPMQAVAGLAYTDVYTCAAERQEWKDAV